jgi:lipid-A-disaccharide synthase
MTLVPAWLAHWYVKVKYVSLGNLILDRMAFREFLMDELTPKALLEEVSLLTEDADYRQHMLDDYAQIRTLLGGAGASGKVAKAMIESL